MAETELDTELDTAQAFVKTLSDAVIHILSTEDTRTGREAAFDALLRKHANMRRIARFTLGAAVRSLSDADFARFQSLLHDLVVKVYANRLGTYSDETLRILGGQSKGRNFIIASRIEFANGRDPIPIDWWIIREKDGRLTLFDLRVLGVWMAQEQRESFASILRNNQNNIAALLAHLQTQTTQQTSD